MFSKGQRTAGLAVATVLTALYSVPSLSAVQTWSFSDAAQDFSSTSFGNSLSQSSGGINLITTGWSDTTDITTGSGVDTIQTGKLIWANSTALGIQNQDEPNDPSSPHHSVDSVTSGGTDPDGEFEMLLLTFSEAVTLDGIDLNWAYEKVGSTVYSRADVSILAWNGTGSATLDTKTWSNVLASNGGGYTSVGNYADVGTPYYAINTDIQSTKWLIGVYNPVFGSGTGLDGANDGLKLASLQTSTTPPDRDVPVPGTIPLILAGLAALRVRGARKAKVR